MSKNISVGLQTMGGMVIALSTGPAAWFSGYFRPVATSCIKAYLSESYSQSLCFLSEGLLAPHQKGRILGNREAEINKRGRPWNNNYWSYHTITVSNWRSNTFCMPTRRSEGKKTNRWTKKSLEKKAKVDAQWPRKSLSLLLFASLDNYALNQLWSSMESTVQERKPKIRWKRNHFDFRYKHYFQNIMRLEICHENLPNVFARNPEGSLITKSHYSNTSTLLKLILLCFSRA